MSTEAKGLALAPCPFCGGTLGLYYASHNPARAVACGECGAEGPAGDTDAEAAENWNARVEIEDEE